MSTPKWIAFLFALILGLAAAAECSGQVRGVFKHEADGAMLYVEIKGDRLYTLKRVTDSAGKEVCSGYGSVISWKGMTMMHASGMKWDFRVGDPGVVYIRFPNGAEVRYEQTTEDVTAKCSNKKRRGGPSV